MAGDKTVLWGQAHWRKPTGLVQQLVLGPASCGTAGCCCCRLSPHSPVRPWSGAGAAAGSHRCCCLIFDEAAAWALTFDVVPPRLGTCVSKHVWHTQTPSPAMCVHGWHPAHTCMHTYNVHGTVWGVPSLLPIWAGWDVWCWNSPRHHSLWPCSWCRC